MPGGPTVIGILPLVGKTCAGGRDLEGGRSPRGHGFGGGLGGDDGRTQGHGNGGAELIELGVVRILYVDPDRIIAGLRRGIAIAFGGAVCALGHLGPILVYGKIVLELPEAAGGGGRPGDLLAGRGRGLVRLDAVEDQGPCIVDGGGGQRTIVRIYVDPTPFLFSAAVVYVRQAGAAGEGGTADAGDAAGDGHAGQPGAAAESGTADAGDAAGDGHAGQAAAAVEGGTADAGDAAGDGHTGQAGAAAESGTADAGDAAGDGHAGQPGAGVEGGFADAGHAAGDGHAGQAAAAGEGTPADGGDAGFQYRRTDQIAVRGIIECITADRPGAGDRQLAFLIQSPCQTIAAAAGSDDDRIPGLIAAVELRAEQFIVAPQDEDLLPPGFRAAEIDVLQFAAAGEGVLADLGHRAGDHHGPETGKVFKSVIRDDIRDIPLEIAAAAHRSRAGQPAAGGKGGFPQADAIPGNDQAGQAVAAGEGMISDAGDGLGDGQRGQSVARGKSPIADAGDAGGNFRGSEVSAVAEGPVSDGGDAAGDGHAGQATAAVEGPIADAGDVLGDAQMRNLRSVEIEMVGIIQRVSP